ncbi:hypothetical protein [Megamonas hypermegale]|uniref:hypothetical protein n=1 Tax=Megamonas hypermegale TaxID=158847 RepID=UPI0026EDB12E|nr:hypothetical protein [Megamonas hypermegale]
MMLFTKKAKKTIGIFALTCFLATPVSYTMSVSSAAAAALDNHTQFEQRHNPPGPPRGDRDKRPDVKRPAPPKGDRDKKDVKRPAPPRNDRKDKDRPAPPRHDRDNDRWDRDRDKNPPPPPPRHDRDDRWDRDDDKDFDRGDITTAVLVGGVIGAIIAKNT